MGNDNKMKSTKNGKKTDKKFHSKHIKHDPTAESARIIFGLNNPEKEHEEWQKPE